MIRHRLPRIPRITRRHPGQVLALYAVAMVVLLGFVALALDVGYFVAQRRAVQNAADAAAMAGGYWISRGYPEAALNDLARAYAEKHGFRFTTSTPPGEDTIEANPLYIDPDQPGPDRVVVEMTHHVDRFFLDVLYDGPWDISTTAVATMAEEPSPFGLVAIESQNPTAQWYDPGAFGMDLGGNLTLEVYCYYPNAENYPTGAEAPYQGPYDPSDTEGGTLGCGSVGSNQDVTSMGNYTGHIWGNVGAHGTVDSDLSSNLTVEGWIAGDRPLILDAYWGSADPADPWYLSGRADGGAGAPLGPGNHPETNGTCDPTNVPAQPPAQIDGKTHYYPGYYGSLVNVGSGEQVVLHAGAYCFAGGFKANGQDAVITDDVDGDGQHDPNTEGVLLFFPRNAIGQQPFNPQNGQFTLHPLSSAFGSLNPDIAARWGGPYMNLTIWVDKCEVVQLNGNGGQGIVGAVYAPCADMSLNGGGGQGVSQALYIGGTVTLLGTGDLNLMIPDIYSMKPINVYLIQ